MGLPPHNRDATGREVFAILARENANHLLVHLRALVRDRTAVDDLFQETMLIAWRRLPEYDRSRPFGPWLRGIGTRLSLEWRRKSRRLTPIDPAFAEAIEVAGSRFEQAEGLTFDERLASLRECLEHLSPDQDEIVRMVYREGRALRDVAQVQGLNEETIKKRLQRLRGALADCLLAKGAIA